MTNNCPHCGTAWKLVAWAKFADGEMTHMEMSDGSGADFDLVGHGFIPLYAATQDAEQTGIDAA